ncbi:hypothetical protein AMJ44_11935 [candidate division WOR-1 bacterium DG_54_3]|uniref:3-oxoacyl-ACP reductase n=1 Tax=candidate division WOR-1 bacterium DG_54_3 TaxID=1703775 RepID=A0A0S7XR57_UNCSA|nr:MAG: hypothetical protein AMJ44_11935 [candidate division WOR-1 bacterium DG_54_3]
MERLSEVIIVSGGSRGLGAAIVQDLLQGGYRVATFSRSRTPFIDECFDKYSEKDLFYWEKRDGSEVKDIRAFVETVGKKFNGIDGLINNAGLHAEGIFTVFPDREVDRLIDLNIKGAFYLTQACLKYMLLKGSGKVITISSIIGIRGFKGLAVYGATKAALDGFTRALAREFGSYNIRVNAIAPGYLKTDMTKNMPQEQLNQIIRRTPLKRLGVGEDITGIVRFLLSPEAKFLTGQTIVVDGGLTC